MTKVLDCQNCGYPFSGVTVLKSNTITYYSCPRCGHKLSSPITVERPVKEGESSDPPREFGPIVEGK